MKIGIGVCSKINGICTTMGCFKAYNNKEKYFEVYKDINTELLAFFSCTMCVEDGEGKLEKVAVKLHENRIDKVHLGVCVVKCEEDRLGKIKNLFMDVGLNIIEGTH